MSLEFIKTNDKYQSQRRAFPFLLFLPVSVLFDSAQGLNQHRNCCKIRSLKCLTRIGTKRKFLAAKTSM